MLLDSFVKFDFVHQLSDQKEAEADHGIHLVDDLVDIRVVGKLSDPVAFIPHFDLKRIVTEWITNQQAYTS